MSTKKPRTRIGADKPQETRHLTEAQKQTLDLQAEAEHESGQKREYLTRRMSSDK